MVQDSVMLIQIRIMIMKLHDLAICFYKYLVEIEVWIINLHNCTMDLCKSFTIIEESYPITDFQISRIMGIHDTNDDSCCELWDDRRITKMFH